MADSIKLFCPKCDQKLEIEMVPGVRSVCCPVCSSEIIIPIIKKMDTEETPVAPTPAPAPPQEQEINFEHLHQVFQSDEEKEKPELPKFSPEPKKSASKKSSSKKQKKEATPKKSAPKKPKVKAIGGKKGSYTPGLRPPKSSFDKYAKPLITVLIIFIILFGGYKFLMNEINKENFRKAQEQSEREAAMREKTLKKEQLKQEDKKQWKALLDSIKPSKLKTEKEFTDALNKIKKFKGGNPNEKIKLITKIKKQKKIRIATVTKELELEAESLANEKKYDEAVALLQDYTGDFAKETAKLRNKAANKYMAALDNLSEKQSLDAEKEEDEKMLFLTDVCKNLLLEDYSAAKQLFNSSKYKADFPEIKKYLNNLQRIRPIIIDSFKKQINKVITINAQNKSHKLLLKSVSINGTLNFEHTDGKVKLIKKFTFSDLDPTEIITRLAKYDKTTAAIYAGIKAASIKKYDKAEKYLSDAEDLDIPFIEALNEMRSGNLVKTKKMSKKEELSEDLDFSKVKVTCKLQNSSKKDPKIAEKYIENLKLDLTIKNNNKVPLSGVTLKIFFIGKSPSKKYLLNTIHAYSKKLYVKSNGFFSKTLSYKNIYSGEIKLDVAGGSFGVSKASGYKFYAWLWTLIDSNGDVVAAGSNLKKFKLNPQKVIASKGKEFRNF